jgi:radical SAM protein with 4Fe4S-binding SPASM domain
VNISNRIIFRNLGEYLIIEDIQGKFIHKINDTGKKIFDFIKESDNLTIAKEKVCSFYSNFESEHVENIFQSFVQLLVNNDIIYDGKTRTTKTPIKFEIEDEKLYKKLKEETDVYASTNRIPLKIQIEAESRCNYDCVHCFLNGSRETPSCLSLKKEHYLSLFNDFNHLGVREVIFSGGEPFIRNDFLEILELTKKFGFMIKIFTNGSLINDKCIEILKKIRLSNLQISFYGSEEEYDNFSRTKGHFKKIMATLKKLKENDINFYLVIPLTKKTLSPIGFYKKLSDDYDCSFFSYIFNALKGRNVNISSKIMLDSNNEYLIKFHEPQQMPNGCKGKCIGGLTHAAINSKGFVFPCYEYIAPVGSIHNNSFLDIWENSKDLKNIVKINLEGNTNVICEECLYKAYCRYCFGKNFQDTGNPKILSQESCKLARQEYEIAEYQKR